MQSSFDLVSVIKPANSAAGNLDLLLSTPTIFPTRSSLPSSNPSKSPSFELSRLPTSAPSIALPRLPTNPVLHLPTAFPTRTDLPSPNPTKFPTGRPQIQPNPTSWPSELPAASKPTIYPSLRLTNRPNLYSSVQPTSLPTNIKANNLKLFHNVRTSNAIVFTSTQQKALVFAQFQKNLNNIEHLNSKLGDRSSLHFGINQFAFDNVSYFRGASMGIIFPNANPLKGSEIVHGRPSELMGMTV